jgi:hypothetical protein
MRDHELTWADRLTGGVAAVVAVASLLVASFLVPSAVDAVATNEQQGLDVVRVTAAHPTAIRVGFLLVVLGLLCLGPAVRGLRALAPDRGRVATGVGWRLVAVGSAAGAVGNAYATLVLPSTAGLDPAVMATFVHRHETSAASFAILAFYALLPIGGVLLTVGLIRARTVPWWQPLLVGIPVVAFMPAPLGPVSAVLALAAGAGLALQWRAVPAARPGS